MSLASWITVDVDLPDHPKVAALEEALGEQRVEAYLLRIWAWAARVVTTGRLRGVSAVGSVERAARWSGAPGVLVNALVETGWVDRDGDVLEIHGWEEHAGKFLKKAEAERQRWHERKERRLHGDSAEAPRELHAEKEKEKEKEIKTTAAGGAASEVVATPVAPKGPTPEDLQSLWNANTSAPIARWTALSPRRRAAAQARLSERPSLDEWTRVIQRIAASDFCCGAGDRAWVATPDFLLRPDTAIKALEGAYDNRPQVARARTGSAAIPPPAAPTEPCAACGGPATSQAWAHWCCDAHRAGLLDYMRRESERTGAPSRQPAADRWFDHAKAKLAAATEAA